MSFNVFSLPRELRDQIYEQVLSHQERIDPWNKINQPLNLTFGLLYVSKIIHREVSSVLYGRNCFDFSVRDSEDVASFLGQIGRHNAECIRHMCIDFPDFTPPDSDDVSLEYDSANILANIRSTCANFNTLTTSIDSTNAMELRLDALDNYKVIDKALELVNAQFRTITSLQKVIIEVYEDSPSDYVRRQMESYGWILHIMEHVEEESDRSFSDFDYDYGGYNSSDHDDHDSYDIDNDSDFWRRAAD